MKLCLSVAALLVFLCSCPAADGAPRNVVLFVTDDQGQDAGCYGNPVLKTPNLDRLAADGTRFQYAFCTTASCSPSRSVILTGLFNHATGQYGLQHSYHHFSGYENLKSLPVLLKQGGYRTARIGKFHVDPEPAYHFETQLPGNPRNPVEMANHCSAFLTETSDKPFFLYFCTTDPHRGGGPAKEVQEQPDRFGNKPAGEEYPGVVTEVYKPEDVIVPPFLPDTAACRAELAQYYQSVSRIDQGLGRLLRVLREAGKYEDTLILYISDHGVPFPGAKTTAYEPGLRAPCVVRHPGAKRRGVVSQALVSWVDLVPTILDYAQVPLPPKTTLHGRSFLAVLEQQQPAGWDEVYASHTFHEVTMYYPMRVVRGRKYKLIWNVAHPLPFPFASDLFGSATWQDARRRGDDFMYGRRTIRAYMQRPQFELYDLERDPHEVQNLAGDAQHAGVLAELKGKLRAFQERTGDPWVLKWERE